VGMYLTRVLLSKKGRLRKALRQTGDPICRNYR
jgi:hypothetical protein